MLTESPAPAEHFAPVPGPRHGWLRWPLWILILLAFIWLADAGISLLIQHSRLRLFFTQHLSTAFGRPVEVGNYDFSLWSGPMLEAESVTVAEDPRFGHEYFLRAQSLGVRLRWPSLLRGHLELGTLSLSQPNLNLVRNASGDWNLAEWLPRPPDSLASPTPYGPVRAPGHVLRFRRIDIEDGRINFKHGNEKLPFAFTNVGGYVDAESPGRWQLNLEAVPSRAAVAVQHAGTLHL
ncbi:MAG: AsmA family protein, partial [Blastocatellia bacterium]